MVKLFVLILVIVFEMLKGIIILCWIIGVFWIILMMLFVDIFLLIVIVGLNVYFFLWFNVLILMLWFKKLLWVIFWNVFNGCWILLNILVIKFGVNLIDNGFFVEIIGFFGLMFVVFLYIWIEVMLFCILIIFLIMFKFFIW